MSIHPTAVVDPQAKIHEKAEIGPLCVIDGDVEIGEGTWLDSHVRVYNGARIGKFNRIYHASAIGADPQNLGWDLSIKSGVKIGDRNVLREYFRIHRSQDEGGYTTIGNDCFLMEGSIVSHDSHLGDHIIMVHDAATSGHVNIASHAFISGLTAIHQFCNIGAYAMVAGCAKIVKDVPPFATADGNPATIIGINAVGMKRAGFDPEVRKKIKNTYKTIYHSNLNIGQALKKLEDDNDPTEEVQMIVKFFRDAERGVTDHR